MHQNRLERFFPSEQEICICGGLFALIAQYALTSGGTIGGTEGHACSGKKKKKRDPGDTGRKKPVTGA